ncbi:hypothetical protein I4U23_028228 [Adineta vaga]|nr:hypothetical protein I4U23_028228 [Adineta vaga]
MRETTTGCLDGYRCAMYELVLECQNLNLAYRRLENKLRIGTTRRSFDRLVINAIAVNIHHTSYFFALTYFTPFLIVIIIYGIIYRPVIQSSVTVQHSAHLTKRDLDLIRNIFILLVIFLIAGIPSLIQIILITKNHAISNAFYMFTIVATSIATMIEKICLIFLNKDIWKEIKKFSNKLHPSPTILLRNTRLISSTRLDNRS